MEYFKTENLSNQDKPTIKVIGSGGTGCNAINTMIDRGLRGVDFIAVNTDISDLKKSKAGSKIQIGKRTAHGLGSGGNPDIGRESAREDQAKIEECLEGADIVIITAGMGGGTGTGSSPIIALTSRKMGILTVGVVGRPFGFEGPKRNKQAQHGIIDLEYEVDTLIVIPNDRLTTIQNISIIEAFQRSDEALYHAVRGITDIITTTGYSNVDIDDVKSVIRTKGGKALVGIGYAKGPNKGIEAAEAAITSPLLEDISIDSAQGILLNVTADPNFRIEELHETCSYVRERVDDDTDLVYRLIYDYDAKDYVHITLIATGIGSSTETTDSFHPFLH